MSLSGTRDPQGVLGGPVLRTEADPVTSFDRELRDLVADLEDTVRVPFWAGVAAPQIGTSLQHETDYLSGRRYIDTLTGDVRRQALRELRRIGRAPRGR